MQQLTPSTTVHYLITQENSLKLLKSIGSTAEFTRVLDNNSNLLSILVFSDVGRHCDCAQLCYIAGLLIGEIESSSLFHVLSWIFHKYERPV